MAGVWHDQELFWRGAGGIVFHRHFHRDEAIGFTMDQQHRHAAVFQRVYGRIIARMHASLAAAIPFGHLIDGGIVQMQILFRDLVPDGGGRGEAAVSQNAADVFRQCLICCHQHSRCAHGDACEIDGELPSSVFIQPLDPVQTVIALQHAKADVIALTVPLCALFNVEHAAAVLYPEVSDRAEIAPPEGSPAVHSEDNPLRLCAREPVADQLCVVIALGRYRLVGRISEMLLCFIDPGAVLRRNGIFPQRLRHLAAELRLASVHGLCHEKARYTTHRSEACRADGRECGKPLFCKFRMLHTITPFS